MKRNLLLLLALFLGLASVTEAQEYAVKRNKFKDNWFLEVPKVGATMGLGSDWGFKSVLKDATTPYVGLSFGKYFSPIFGTRVDLGGYMFKNRFNNMNPSNTLKAYYINTNVDLMVNMINLFKPYNPERKFDLYGIFGVGYLRHLGYDNAVSDFGASTNDLVGGTKNFINTRIGLQGAFHVSQLVDINLELNGNIIHGNFMASNRKYSGYLNASVGVAYKFKKRGWEVAEAVEPGLVASLNDEINRQRGELDSQDKEIQGLRNELKDCCDENKALKNKLDQCEKDKKTAKNEQAIVTYRIGKTEVSKEQLVSIYNIAQSLKENEDATVEIHAYADSKTGSARRNMQLTEMRAENIKKLLVENYDIDESRIKTFAHGCDEQVYDNNDWNRISVIVVK